MVFISVAERESFTNTQLLFKQRRDLNQRHSRRGDSTMDPLYLVLQ